MTFKSTGRRKLTQFMSYHLLSDINRNMLLSIVNCNRMSDHVRNNHTGTRPGFQYFLITFFLQYANVILNQYMDPFSMIVPKGIPPPIIFFSSQSIYQYFYSCGFYTPSYTFPTVLLAVVHNELYSLHPREDGQSGS